MLLFGIHKRVCIAEKEVVDILSLETFKTVEQDPGQLGLPLVLHLLCAEEWFNSQNNRKC